MNSLINRKFKRYTHSNLSEWTDRVKKVELHTYTMKIREANPDVASGYVDKPYTREVVIIHGETHSHRLDEIVFVS